MNEKIKAMLAKLENGEVGPFISGAMMGAEFEEKNASAIVMGHNDKTITAVLCAEDMEHVITVMAIMKVGSEWMREGGEFSEAVKKEAHKLLAQKEAHTEPKH